MSGRQWIDLAAHRFGVADQIQGRSDREVYAMVRPWLGANSLPQLCQMLQARLPPHVRLGAVVSPPEQQHILAVVQHWRQMWG